MENFSSTAYDHCLKPFVVAITTKILQLLKLLVTSPIEDDDGVRANHGDPEAALEQAYYKDRSNKYRTNNLDWAKITVVYCLTAAIGLALLPVQIHSQQLPIAFHFLGLTILLAFTCILISKFVPYIPGFFHNFGLLFGVTSFFISITIPFPMWFKCTAYSIYVAAFLLILLCNLHFNKHSKGHDHKLKRDIIVVDPAVSTV